MLIYKDSWKIIFSVQENLFLKYGYVTLNWVWHNYWWKLDSWLRTKVPENKLEKKYFETLPTYWNNPRYPGVYFYINITHILAIYQKAAMYCTTSLKNIIWLNLNLNWLLLNTAYFSLTIKINFSTSFTYLSHYCTLNMTKPRCLSRPWIFSSHRLLLVNWITEMRKLISENIYLLLTYKNFIWTYEQFTECIRILSKHYLRYIWR